MSTSVAAIDIITVSDRANQGVYEDKSDPAAEAWLQQVIISPITVTRQIIAGAVAPKEQPADDAG